MYKFVKKIIPNWIKNIVSLYKERLFLKEICDLKIMESGVSDDFLPWVRLESGLTFYGGRSTQRQKYLYKHVKKQLPNLIEDAMSVVWEIVDRYSVPRSLPGETVCNPVQTRELRDPLNDFLLNAKERQKVAKIFKLNIGDICVDVGAFHGYGTMRLADIVGDTGAVVAIETDPEALIILKENIRVNNYTNILIVNKAASDHKGKDSFYRIGHTASSLNEQVLSDVCQEDAAIIEVETSTVDCILQELGIQRCNHVSITVNGAEPEVLMGMQETLSASLNVRITIAGWYYREGRRIAEIVNPVLKKMGFNVITGKLGRVLAWK